MSEQARSNKKKLILALDGTWQDGTTEKDRERGTNIWKLTRAINRRDENNCHQIVYYQSGVGTNESTAGVVITNQVKSIVEGATGTGLATKVKDAYLFLARNWEPGDEVYIFGFSRGAYTARTTAALIGDIGFLGKEDQESFWEIYEHYQLAGASPGSADRKKADAYLTPWRKKKVDWEAQNLMGAEKFTIRVLGVFDTVGAMGIPILSPKQANYFGFNDLHLGRHIEHAFHAMALNENRSTFSVTKWQFDNNHQPAPGQTVKQVWFAGSHSDIGGGWPDSDLSMVSLAWMASNVKDMLSLDLRFVIHDFAFKPYRPWGNLRPHDPIALDSVIPGGSWTAGFRSNSITPSAPTNTHSAVELIHPSVFQQNFDNAPKLWPEPIKAIVKRAQADAGKSGGTVAELADIEVELRDVTFKEQIRLEGKGPLLAYGPLVEAQDALGSILNRAKNFILG